MTEGGTNPRKWHNSQIITAGEFVAYVRGTASPSEQQRVREALQDDTSQLNRWLSSIAILGQQPLRISDERCITNAKCRNQKKYELLHEFLKEAVPFTSDGKWAKLDRQLNEAVWLDELSGKTMWSNLSVSQWRLAFYRATAFLSAYQPELFQRFKEKHLDHAGRSPFNR